MVSKLPNIAIVIGYIGTCAKYIISDIIQAVESYDIMGAPYILSGGTSRC